MMTVEPASIKAPCERCAGTTTQNILHSDESSGSDPDGTWWEKIDQMIKCAGCGSVSLRRGFTFSEWVGAEGQPLQEVTYYPARLTRSMPSWFEQLPPELNDLLKEVYEARRANWGRLTAMGVRAVIDYVMRAELKDDDTFENQLLRLEESGLIGKKQRETLSVVVDVGSAAGHRGFKPSLELIDAMLDVVEIMLNQQYNAGPMVEAHRLVIPPRPPRRRKGSVAEEPKNETRQAESSSS